MPYPANIARVPIHGGPLVDPYQLDPQAIIKDAESFTVSINTVSQSLYSNYKNEYYAGRYDNDYFILLSSIGLGDISKPIVKLHLLEHINSIQQDFTSIWAENVETVEDYREQTTEHGESYNRLYLSFQSFCQDIGNNDTYSQIRQVGTQLCSMTGSIFPQFMLYTSIADGVITGITRILEKFEKDSQCKKVEFSLYPASEELQPNVGEAPLQTGAYVLFYENVDITQLEMSRDGVVHSTSNIKVPPYIVVNVKKGITNAPKTLNVEVAAEIFAFHLDKYGFGQNHDGSGKFVEALEELGASVKSVQYIERYYQLKRKQERTPEEEERMKKLRKALENKFPNFDQQDPLLTRT